MLIKLSNYANPSYLVGNTEIYRYFVNRKHMTIKELYEKHQSASGREYNRVTLLRSIDSDTVVKNTLVNVLYSGRQIVYEIRTKLGYSIRATKDTMLFNNTTEELRVRDIIVGTPVYVNNKEEYTIVSDTVTYIERLGKEDTYSIEMDPLYNTFIANGFVIYYS